MANKCCICKKEIPFFATDYALSSDLPKKRVCDDCRRMIDTLRRAIKDNEAELGCASKEKLKEYLKTVTDQDVVAFCDSIISQGETLFVEQTKLSQEMEEHLLTSGYNFEGYKIIKYNGIISGQVVLGTGFLSELTASLSDFLGVEADKFSSKLNVAKEAALKRLIRESVNRGGNAVIGIDFDYITFSNNMIGVIANGTSVVLEK